MMTLVGSPRTREHRRFVVVTRVTGRLMRWQLSLGVLGLSALVIWQTSSPPDVDRTVLTLSAALGLAPILVDSAAVTVASSPTPLRRRFAHRVVWVAPAVACWALVQWVLVADPHRVLPPRWVMLELASSVAIVLAAEQITARATRATGLTGVAALLCVVAVVASVSRWFAVIPVRDHELRVASIGAVAIAVCWIASRDPALRNSALRLNRQSASPRQIEKEQSISEGTCKSAQVGSSPQLPRC
jgi:hypothetical protein